MTASIEAITELTDQLPADATLAVVAHGGVTLRTIAGDEKIQANRPGLLTHGLPCGAITVLERTGLTWKVNELRSTAHLDQAVQHRPA